MGKWGLVHTKFWQICSPYSIQRWGPYKGQLITQRPFGVFKSPLKKQEKNFKDFSPSLQKEVNEILQLAV